MTVIDFHSHILPKIDDGSQSIEMSGQMLEMGVSQGVNVIVATPHFYADRMTMEGFLKKRTEAYGGIQDAIGNQGIRLALGAEVAFFYGMGNADGLDKLTIADTPLLLLEMPFRAWSTGDIREIENLLDRGLKPVMAHIERFYPYQRDKRIFDELYSLPVFVQLNAESLLNWRTSRLALKLLKEGKAHLLGSDCHNVTSRPPNLAEGRNIIEKKLGNPRLVQIDRLGEEVLELYEKAE